MHWRILSVLRVLFAYVPLLGVFVVASLSLYAQPASAATGINEQLNFQGRLFNSQGATVADGYYNIEFKIYRDGDGQSVGNSTGSPAGALLWTEDHLNNNSQGVQVKNGFLSVQLGSVTAFGGSIDWNQDTLWLSMNIGSTNGTCTPFSSCSPDGEMVPMKRLSSSPYALNAGKLGGLTSSQYVQLAQGLQTDATTNPSIYINKTGGSGNLMTLQSSGTTVYQLTNAGDITLGANANHTLSVSTAGAGVAGKSLTVVAGASGSGGGLSGGDLILQGGTGTGTTGSVIVKANTADTAGAFIVKNAAGSTLLNVDSTNKALSLGSGFTLPIPNFTTPTTATTGGSIANGTTYYYGIIASDGTTETELSPVVSVTISSVTNTNTVTLNWSRSYGATSYKIYRNTSNSFSSGSLLLTTIGSGSTITYTDTGTSTSSGLPIQTVYSPTLFRVDSAATNPFGTGQTAKLGSMYYNTTNGEFQCYKDSDIGGAWADCGVTTLQGAYDNATNSGTEPSIKVDSTHSTFNIQDANSTIGADLLDIRASNGSGLGAVMFGVASTGLVTIQNPSDLSSSLRVLNSAGAYVVNVNTSSGYFITNTTRELANQLQNPDFEAGGSISGGQQGWIGPAQASIVNSSSDAYSGNYGLQVTPNSSTLKTYAGTYYRVAAGDVIYFEAWVKRSSGGDGTGGVLIEGFDKDKAAISNAETSSLPGTSYALVSASYTVPSNVVYVRVSALVNSSATAGTYYFDNFYLNSSQRGKQAFMNTSDSTTAFRILSAGAAQTLLTGNTTDNIVKIGDSTGSNTATTMFVVDSATADPSTLTSRDGGLYYRSDTGSLKTVISGSVYDICTTATVCSGYGASAGSIVQLQASSPGTAQTGNFNISGTGILTQLQTQDQSASSTNSSALTIRTGNATGSSSNSGNLTIDVGTATGTVGSITIGHSGVATTLPGTLVVQAANALALGTASTNTGVIKLYNNVGPNTVSIAAAGANPTSSWTFTLPQDPSSNSGYCLKATDTNGALGFSDCGAGATVTLQDTYTNSSSPATITLANSKDIKIVSQETATDPNILFDLQCTTCSASGGRFAVQNGGTDVFTVNPNSGSIVIGSSTTNGTQTNLQLDSFSTFSDVGACTTTAYQGALYYNTNMHSIRTCKDAAWTDVITSSDLGMLLFGVVPESGSSNQGDLPSLATAGVSGPCKVSWNTNTSVTINACVAYSGGRRIKIGSTTLNTNSASSPHTSLTTTNIWGHICIDTTDGTPKFTATNGNSSETANMPTFSVSAPVLCLASIKGSGTTNGRVAGVYDTRTFTSTPKEAVTVETTAASTGWLVNVSNGHVKPVANGTDLRGVVVATDGSTSTTNPNAIIAYAGPAWAKANAGTVAKYVQNSATAGYANTTNSFPASGAYAVLGFARTGYTITLSSGECTAASSCVGSLYVNLNIR